MELVMKIVFGDEMHRQLLVFAVYDRYNTRMLQSPGQCNLAVM